MECTCSVVECKRGVCVKLAFALSDDARQSAS